MSLAAGVTKADDFSAPDGKSQSIRHRQIAMYRYLADGCGPVAATAILAVTNFRCFER
jgi:hypothetical protein